jgi:hypothetical protein
VEPLRARLLAEAEKRKRNVGASFKPASPMKQSATPGDFTGTLGGKVLYEPVRGPAGHCMRPAVVYCRCIMAAEPADMLSTSPAGQGHVRAV